jgi:hypothetical protein
MFSTDYYQANPGGIMRASELVARLQAGIAACGDVRVFQGDMVSVQIETVNAGQPELYGKNYIHIGAW